MNFERNGSCDQKNVITQILQSLYNFISTLAIDGREEASKYVIINVTEKKERFQLLINPDETDVDVRRGDDVQILCPTNHDSSTPQDRPICRFISPSGKRYDLIGK